MRWPRSRRTCSSDPFATGSPPFANRSAPSINRSPVSRLRAPKTPETALRASSAQTGVRSGFGDAMALPQRGGCLEAKPSTSNAGRPASLPLPVRSVVRKSVPGEPTHCATDGGYERTTNRCAKQRTDLLAPAPAPADCRSRPYLRACAVTSS